MSNPNPSADKKGEPPRLSTPTDESRDVWVAVQPPSPTTPRQQGQVRLGIEPTTTTSLSREPSGGPPPSFTDSQFGIIFRRQRQRPPDNSGLKTDPGPSRFINLSNSFEFAGWGSLTRLKMTEDDFAAARSRVDAMHNNRVLGQFTASALAGNAVLGSVFYALPAVVAVGGVYSPISLFIATLILFLWRPIMEELASALPISGAPYTYILNVSTKGFALIGAALLLLDFASTSVVSAATAAAYLAGEIPDLPFATWVGTLIVLILFTIVSLMGIRESARIALTILSLHCVTMVILIIAASVKWGQIGISQFKENWDLHQSRTGTSPTTILRQVYYGFCLGMLGLTGFECTPSYISRIKDGQFPRVLRNLHIPAIIFNATIMTLVLAIVPLDVVLGGANVLSVLAHRSAGAWLRTWITIDAIVVLCAGVLTGILSACELFEQLSLHRVLPGAFLRVIPATGSPYVSVISFVIFGAIIYASTAASLTVVSAMFSFVWLTVMALFPLSLILLKFNRGRLPRKPFTRLGVVFAALVIVPIVLAGNIAVNPATAGYFSAYFCGIVLCFTATQKKMHLLRWVYWLYDQYPSLHMWQRTKAWDNKLVSIMNRLRRKPVCILVKSDEINQLFHMALYVSKNEETSYLKMIHIYEPERGIPSELEANAKILDEAFPEITIDLILVEGMFDPLHIAALSHHLSIPQSLMFMTCPGNRLAHPVADFGTRIISL